MASDPPSEPALRADAQRNVDAVLSTGAEVLSRNPQASIAEIAAASGVGRATVYRHFPNRDALIDALVAQVQAEGKQLFERELERGASAVETLTALLGQMAALGGHYRFLDDQRRAQTQFREVDDDEASAFYAFVRGRVAAGELRPDTDPRWLLAAMRGLVMVALDEIDVGAATLDQGLARARDTLLRGVIPG